MKKSILYIGALGILTGASFGLVSFTDAKQTDEQKVEAKFEELKADLLKTEAEKCDAAIEEEAQNQLKEYIAEQEAKAATDKNYTPPPVRRPAPRPAPAPAPAPVPAEPIENEVSTTTQPATANTDKDRAGATSKTDVESTKERSGATSTTDVEASKRRGGATSKTGGN